MSVRRCLIFAVMAALAFLAQAPDLEAGSGKKHRIHRGGEHYDNVMSNYTRRCADLSGQFARAQAERPDSPLLSDATLRYQRGVALCDGGARMQGIDELTAAIRMIGAIPRVSL